MPVQAGEHSPRGHQLAGLIPAMGMAEAGGIALALSVKDHIQPADTQSITHTAVVAHQGGDCVFGWHAVGENGRHFKKH